MKTCKKCEEARRGMGNIYGTGHKWSGFYSCDACNGYGKPLSTKQILIVALDNFEEAYFIAALWAGRKYPNSENDDTNLDEYHVSDFGLKDLKSALKDCRAFKEANSVLLNSAYAIPGYTASHAGHDFYLTRNGSGAGFWDRDLGQVGKALTDACKAFPTVYTERYNGRILHHRG